MSSTSSGGASVITLRFALDMSMDVAEQQVQAAINAATGEVQAPAAGGNLGSGDSLTGAEEQFRGEAVEQEATNFVSGITTLAVGSVAGEGAPSVDKSAEASENEEDGLVVKKEEDLIDPTNMTAGIHEAKAATAIIQLRSTPSIRKGSRMDSRLAVKVPVLSEQRISTPASDSMAVSFCTMAFSLAR